MRIAIISDIHSNLEALNGVFHAIDDLAADSVYCLGDIVGYGPHPNECIQLVRKRCSAVVKGNHDAGAIGELPGRHFNSFGSKAIRWTAEHLSNESHEYLKSLPLIRTEGDITLAHATPREPDSWQYLVAWGDMKPCFKAFTTALCFVGHTHTPLVICEDGSVRDFTRGKRFLINVGSVGQPRDGIPRASFGMFDSVAWTYKNIRVTYDINKTAEAIKKAELPEYLGQRLFVGV